MTSLVTTLPKTDHSYVDEKTDNKGNVEQLETGIVLEEDKVGM